MTPRGRCVGAVLAGGESRRYGRPKWREEVGGRAMAARALAALAPHLAACLVVGSDSGLAALGAPLRADLRPGRGPLGGLETALAWARGQGASHVLTLACDLPLVGADTVGAVLAAVGGPEAAVVPRTDDGPQPLCAAYPVGALPAVAALLDGGGGSLQALLACLDVVWLEAAELPGGASAFLNVNEPAARRRAERVLRRRR